MDPLKDDWGDERAPVTRSRTKKQVFGCVNGHPIPKGQIPTTVTERGTPCTTYCEPCYKATWCRWGLFVVRGLTMAAQASAQGDGHLTAHHVHHRGALMRFRWALG